LLTASPAFCISAFMIWFTSGTQPPQAVPAPVQAFSAAMSQAPPATASQWRPC
jgi:hypothetical protein